MDERSFQVQVKDILVADLADVPPLTVDFPARDGDMYRVQVETGGITVKDAFPARGTERRASEFAYDLAQQVRRALKGY